MHLVAGFARLVDRLGGSNLPLYRGSIKIQSYTIPMLSLEQERFLTEFYALCRQYRQAGIVAYSYGFIYDGYEVALRIQPQPIDTANRSQVAPNR